MIKEFLNELKEKGWKQQEIANKVGLGQSYICELMKGKTCGIETVIKIADAYGVTTDEVLGRKKTIVISPIIEKVIQITEGDIGIERIILKCAEDEKLLKEVRGKGGGKKAA